MFQFAVISYSGTEYSITIPTSYRRKLADPRDGT